MRCRWSFTLQGETLHPRPLQPAEQPRAPSPAQPTLEPFSANFKTARAPAARGAARRPKSEVARSRDNHSPSLWAAAVFAFLSDERLGAEEEEKAISISPTGY
ncbi:hypothetical protein G7046_g4071 [Stylonectria norvegica]|nr:hypothetical protein G7046_g4071 [Stylonectria norvegica]